MQHAAILLELQYLPPVQYMSKLVHYPIVFIEAQEHYLKASYRNRTHIASANGVLRLSVPLVSGKNAQKPIREVQIAYDEPWQKLHWEGIQSAYGNAPFFLHYTDILQPFFEREYEFLFDWNWRILQTICQLIGFQPNIEFTSEFQTETPASVLDWRNAISPKLQQQQPDPHFQPAWYAQVFEEKHGFLPNLSILDLLFCAGPEALSVLQTSFVFDAQRTN